MYQPLIEKDSNSNPVINQSRKTRSFFFNTFHSVIVVGKCLPKCMYEVSNLSATAKQQCYSYINILFATKRLTDQNILEIFFSYYFLFIRM